MTDAADLPAWAALLASFLVLFGAGFTMVGAIGLSRLKTFYERMHAPTLGTTGGAGAILFGSIVFFFLVLQSRRPSIAIAAKEALTYRPRSVPTEE